MKRLILLTAMIISGCNTIQPSSDSSNEVTQAVIKDKISKEDLEKWYSLYRGTYIWSHDLELLGCNNYDDVFNKFRDVRAKVSPTKGNVNLTEVTDKLLSEFKTAEFTQENHDKLNDKLALIYTGIKEAL